MKELLSHLIPGRHRTNRLTTPRSAVDCRQLAQLSDSPGLGLNSLARSTVGNSSAAVALIATRIADAVVIPFASQSRLCAEQIEELLFLSAFFRLARTRRRRRGRPDALGRRRRWNANAGRRRIWARRGSFLRAILASTDDPKNQKNYRLHPPGHASTLND